MFSPVICDRTLYRLDCILAIETMGVTEPASYGTLDGFY